MNGKNRCGLVKWREEVTARVKQAREGAGLTQSEMAQLLRLKQPTYAKYEVSRRMPVELMSEFCSICGVRVEWLINGEGSMAKPKAQ